MSKIKLRPYQLEFVSNLSKSVAKNGRIIACAPTGSGKSKTFITISEKSTSKGRAVIIISESVKIHKQISDEAGGTDIANGVRFVSIENGRLYVAMAQTLVRRPLILRQINQLDPPPLVIVDEAHIGTPTNLLKKLNPDIMILGFTATPDARVAKHLPELYSDCVICCSVDDLIQQNFLCSYTHYARSNSGLSVLELRNGEYTEASQNNAFNTNEVYEGIFDDLDKIPYTKCMIFVASIAHCEDMYIKLQERGYRATRYHSKLGKSASYELAKFTELGIADICVSVGSLTKGFDFPEIDLVILNRATTSLPLYLQMIGRASRPVFATNKNHFYCLDYGGNWERHGLYWDDRPWDILWKQKKKTRKSLGTMTVAQCEQCDAIISASVNICPYCGYKRPKTEKELAQGELVEITASYNNLVGRAISTLSPQELSVYAKMKVKQRFAARIAKAREQQTPGFIREFGKAMGYKPGWADMQISMIGDEPIEFTDITLR